MVGPPKPEQNRNDKEKDSIAIAIAKRKHYFSPMYSVEYLSSKGNSDDRIYSENSPTAVCEGCLEPSNVFITIKIENKERCPICFQTGCDAKPALQRRKTLSSILTNFCEFDYQKHIFKIEHLPRYDRKLRQKNERYLFIFSTFKGK